MRFALAGTHPDGVAMVSALVASGRHQLLATTAPLEAALRERLGINPRPVHDLEELLADPAIEAVVIAGKPAHRAGQLRRALQSERHVLCVHPCDQMPDGAYEAAMIRNDTGWILFPLLPEMLHPAVVRLADFLERPRPGLDLRSPVGAFVLLDSEWQGDVLLDGDIPGHKLSLPGWNLLRRLGGEISEVLAVTPSDEVEPSRPVLLTGRFQQGGLFRTILLPSRTETTCRLAVVGDKGRAELTLPVGWAGPACLTWHDPPGQLHEEYFEPWDPWPALVERFEAALTPSWPDGAQAITTQPAGTTGSRPVRANLVLPQPVWQDEVRALELDDAARRSAVQRRGTVLDYQEASEAVGFKGTMTLVGCGVLWSAVLLFILSRWFPQIGYVIMPVLLLFLGMQLLRYLIPEQKQ